MTLAKSSWLIRSCRLSAFTFTAHVPRFVPLNAGITSDRLPARF
jgi:hypothetical protein